MFELVDATFLRYPRTSDSGGGLLLRRLGRGVFGFELGWRMAASA